MGRYTAQQPSRHDGRIRMKDNCQ
ncbi:hypothetical protein A2U01_0081936, partial [Trifolium medium]|nr:hypothetical protein [Trifolium medium]